MQTVKSIFKKSAHEGKHPYKGILAFRNTPIEDIEASPAQLLMGRREVDRLTTDD